MALLPDLGRTMTWLLGMSFPQYVAFAPLVLLLLPRGPTAPENGLSVPVNDTVPVDVGFFP